MSTNPGDVKTDGADESHLTHDDVQPESSAEEQPLPPSPLSPLPPSTSQTGKKRRWWYLLDGAMIVLMGALLFWGAASQFYNQYNDATRYQCYAVAFWHGTPGLSTLPTKQCAFLSASSSSALADKLRERGFPNLIVGLVAAQSTTNPLHALPPEYPLLTLAPFSLGLIVPQQWYQLAFALWMALVAGIIYLILQRSRSRTAAIAFAFYLVLGSWATAEGRFDLVTGALTLGAVILASRSKWKWAYALVALATLLKFYPIVLLPPLLIAQQLPRKDKWTAWSRWSGLGVFVAICAGVMAVSLLLNVVDTVNPFRYFFSRPIQIESFPAVLVWVGSFLGRPIQYVFTYQSLNVISSLSSKISIFSTVLLGIGVLYTYWLQWRGKIDLFMSSLITLLIVLAVGKVLSPQYLMWVFPFVAYVGKANWKWLLTWGIISLLTTLIFPFIYVDQAHIIQYYYLVVIRDLLIIATVLALLHVATWRTKKEIAPQVVSGLDARMDNQDF
jgi:Glycosyltransferase family 87